MSMNKIIGVSFLCLAIFAISCGKKEQSGEGSADIQLSSFDDIFLATVAGKDIITIVSIEDRSDLVIPLVEFSEDGRTMTLSGADVSFASASGEGQATYSSSIGTAVIVLEGSKPISILLDGGTDMLSDLRSELHRAHGDKVGVLFILQ